MNRKERRAARRQTASPPAPSSPELQAAQFVQARQHFRQGQAAAAEQACRRLLAGNPAHGASHHLLGLIARESGQHGSAARSFAKAVEADAGIADWHYDLAVSYEALGRRKRAAEHFTRALMLEPVGGWAVRKLQQQPITAGALHRVARSWPKPLGVVEMLGASGIAALAGDTFLQCALKTIWLCDAPLEMLLTRVRATLLQQAAGGAPDFAADDATLALVEAIAQQCFINGYVYAQSEEETQVAEALFGQLEERLGAGMPIPPLLLAAVAAYRPLHQVAGAQALLTTDAIAPLASLLRQQLREPLEELADRPHIPALTAIAGDVTLAVRRQYEENPYPRWTVIPSGKLRGAAAAPDDPIDVLIAGCGTGQNAIDAALLFPGSRVLAVDISLASLAYARRKTREAGIANIEYAQADILRLGTLDRRFDRIESIGVLHHLADPKAGLRELLSLLRRNGVLDVALYSEAARRVIVACRAFIAERGYTPTTEGIRACRQELLRANETSPFRRLTTMHDFFGTSGCRDLLFNIVEHRYTLPAIKALIAEFDLTLLSFDVAPEVLEKFRREFPGADINDLDRWHAFETMHPETFLGMYRLLLRRK